MPHADIESLDYAKSIKQCGWGSVCLIAELDLEIMMATVTYKNQPAIDKTKGKIPLAGNSHVYRVK